MNKTAIIISLSLVAIITAAVFWIYRPANPLDVYIKRAPILLPPQDSWPPDIIAAFSQFKELNGKWREKQEHAIVLFAMRYEHRWNIEDEENNYAPLTRKDILALLGPPDNESKHLYSYKTARQGCSVSYLTIFFNKGKVCFIGSGSGLTSNATEEELIIPPIEKETEQGGPGYPPQGVGSPDP